MNAAPTASAAARFRPGTVTEPGEPSKTTYTYDSTGRVARILAPTAPGVTCVDAQGSYTNAIGCRSLRFDYGTTGSATGRLVSAWLDIYNPDKPGMDSIKVAAHSYDASGRLSTVVDPRSGLGTTYGYDSGSRLTSVKPAGQTPFQLSYTADFKLAGVKRDRPAGDPAGGTAVLASYVYNVPVSGTGFLTLVRVRSVGGSRRPPRQRGSRCSAPTTRWPRPHRAGSLPGTGPSPTCSTPTALATQ